MLKKAMWENAGIIRTKAGLNNALRVIDDVRLITRYSRVFSTKAGYELRNSIITSKLIAEAALRRDNSIGAHFREDAPEMPQVAVDLKETEILNKI